MRVIPMRTETSGGFVAGGSTGSRAGGRDAKRMPTVHSARRRRVETREGSRQRCRAVGRGGHGQPASSSRRESQLPAADRNGRWVRLDRSATDVGRISFLHGCVELGRELVNRRMELRDLGADVALRTLQVGPLRCF